MQTRTIYHSISFFALALVTISLKSVATDGFVVLSLCLVMTVGLSHGVLDYLKGHAVLKTYAKPPLSYFYLVYIAFGCGILGLVHVTGASHRYVSSCRRLPFWQRGRVVRVEQFKGWSQPTLCTQGWCRHRGADGLSPPADRRDI